MRLLSFGLAALLVAVSASGAGAQTLGPVEVFAVGGTVARLWLPPEGPSWPASGAAVVVIGDIAAPDARADLYMERLNSAGLAALELIAPDDGGASLLKHDGIRGALQGAVAALADRRFDPRRVGLLGFGSGARAAFAPAWDPEESGIRWAAVVLLYPDCATLLEKIREVGQAATPGPFLLLHGSADPANPSAACATLSEVLGRVAPTERVEYRGAGYAWDRPRYGELGAELLPSPDGKGRVRSESWPALAEFSAERVVRCSRRSETDPGAV